MWCYYWIGDFALALLGLYGMSLLCWLKCSICKLGPREIYSVHFVTTCFRTQPEIIKLFANIRNEVRYSLWYNLASILKSYSKIIRLGYCKSLLTCWYSNILLMLSGLLSQLSQIKVFWNDWLVENWKHIRGFKFEYEQNSHTPWKGEESNVKEQLRAPSKISQYF